MVVAIAVSVVDKDDGAPVAIVDVEHDARVRVDEDDGAGRGLTHVRVMILGMLASCIYRLEMISPCQAEEPIRARHECICGTVHKHFLVAILERGRLPPTTSANSRTTGLHATAPSRSSHRDSYMRIIVADRSCHYGADAVGAFAV